MTAQAEGEVPARVRATGSEAVRFGDEVRVGARAQQLRQDGGAGGQLHSGQDGGTGGDPPPGEHRGVQAQHLLHAVGRESWLPGGQSAPQLRVSEHPVQGRVDELAGRLLAGDEQEVADPDRRLHAERPSVGQVVPDEVAEQAPLPR